MTLPDCFLTLMVNVAHVLPDTVATLGDTWIWPLLLDVALMEPLPTAPASRTLTVPDPFSLMVMAVLLGSIVQGTGVGVGDGVGDGVGVGVGVGDGVGVGVGGGVAFGSGVALGSGVGDGVAFGSGVGVGVAIDPLGVPLGVGSATTVPPVPFKVGAGTEASSKISASSVTSPDPEMLTLLL